MGYYSDVVLGLSAKATDELKKRVEEVGADKEETSMLACADTHLTYPTGEEVYRWDQVKWYVDYPEVGWIEAFLNDLDPDDYRFIRIGEDYDDIDIRGSLYDTPFSISIERSIVFEE